MWTFERYVVGAMAAAALATPAFAQVPQTGPTTRILAVGTIVPGADLRLVLATLPSEARATTQLYLDGKIDQWYSQQDKRGVVFILNVADPKAASEMLEALPLGQAHLMKFELTPLGPLAPLRTMLAPPAK